MWLMSLESPDQQSAALLRLRVTAEADLGALSRVLERFQNLNIVPRRVVAEMGTADTLHIQVDIFGMSEERLTLITAKLNQALNVLDARWHRL
jgi:(p)ppGpp synthase/HD superfamily hydrolase